MIRACPSCGSERPVTEAYCEAEVRGAPCGYFLLDVVTTEPGTSAIHDPTPPAPAARLCTNGHPMGSGDLLCPECESPPDGSIQPPVPQAEPPVGPSATPPPTVIEGWQLGERLEPASPGSERFLAIRETDGRRAILTLYVQGAALDAAVYDAWRKLPRDHVPQILATGRWQDRPFDVTEELTGEDLSRLSISRDDLGTLRHIVEQLGSALGAFAACGLRHRDLRPSAVQIRSRDPLDLVISGFGSAQVSEFELDIAPCPRITRYTAPEAVAGGVTAASDWWSLGLLLLELLTGGACFEGINDSAFVIHVVTQGVAIPPGLDPSLDLLLRGLLARDRQQRWQWREVRAWLAGEPVEAPAGASTTPEPTAGPGIELAARTYRTAASFALAAAEASRWEEARNLLLLGAVTSWANEAGFEPIHRSSLREVAYAIDVPEDLRLSIALKLLNPAMPLILRGEIVSPAWLLEHQDEGYDLIVGPVPDFLRKIGAEPWLSHLKTRAESVRARARQLEIALNEEDLRVYLLTTSVPRLATLWEERRRLFPDTDHPGLGGLMARRQNGEEDLIVLLSASVEQYRPLTEVLEAAAQEAGRAQVGTFNPETAREWLMRPRRELYHAIDERTAQFARCDNARVDEWADTFRVERRMALPRALALLAVPEKSWHPLPRQSYISKTLDFFSRRITAGVLRGPLARMSIGKSSARIDLTELGTARMPASDILAQLLRRVSRIPVDPAAFAQDVLLERRLRLLHSRAQLYRRDTGIEGLYLGFPFLLMRDPDGYAATRIAPVLLWPVRLDPELGGRGQVSVGFGRQRSEGREAEQVILNPAFEGLMGAEETARWQDAANDLLMRDPLSLTNVMDAFGMLAASRGSTLERLPGNDVEVLPLHPQLAPSAVLFHLAFMGQAIVKDLDHLRGQSPEGTGLETALRLGEASPQTCAIPVRETERYFTAHSDPSQEEAVLEARRAPGVVVEGPPGTGKSQTIVNMVGDCIGRGASLLVICQKQAALEVVRKRLEREGLGERIVMLTDVSLDREPVVKAIRAQVEALHTLQASDVPAWRRQRDELAARIESLESELDRHQTALHRIDERTGLSYRAVLAELMTLGRKHPPAISAPELRRHLSGLHPLQVQAIEEACAPLARFWLRARFEDSPLSPLKPFSPDEGSLELFRGMFRKFLEAERSRGTVLQDTPGAFRIEDGPALRRWLIQHEQTFESLSAQQRTDLVRCHALFRSGARAGVSMLTELLETEGNLIQMDARVLAGPAATKLRALEDEEFEQVAVLTTAATRPAMGLQKLSPRRWLTRRRLRKRLSRLMLPTGTQAVTDFARAASLESRFRPLRRRIDGASRAVSGEPPAADLSPAALAVLTRSLHARLAAVQGLVEASEECADAAEELARVCASGADPGAAFLDRLRRSLRRCEARTVSLSCLEALEPYFEDSWLEARRSTIESESSNPGPLRAIVDALPTLKDYQELRIRAVNLGATELAIFRELRSKEAQLHELAPEQLDACVRHTIATEARQSWKARIENRTPELFLDHDTLAGRVHALAEADAEIRRLNRELLRHIDRSRVRPLREWEEVTRLRGPRALRLRELIDRAIDLGLLALRPVWLMTPDVASRVLQPRAGLFDTVIYDEASQMPVEYALPTLFRAKVVVISGDEKQMPPTAFFSSRLEIDDEQPDDGEEIAIEEEQTASDRRDIQSCPDLLQLGRAVLPKRTLQVHYRSRYRELIAFSNAAFYQNRLSVPVRHPANVIQAHRPIEVIRSRGTYQDQSNPEEAAEVVKYLAHMWRRARPPSVGVVTFNRKQADIIEEAIEARAQNDARFRNALQREQQRIEDGEDMGFFVKNVENVQGDERDVIVFSTTFGRNSQGAFRRNFGALGQVGGERRLNVAVTRAREKVVLITSMPIAEISDMLSSQKRPVIPRDYLQAYMHYASTVSDGKLDEGKALLERVVTEASQPAEQGSERDGFIEDVAEFLRREGWQVADARDGGAFGLDFAIEDPSTGLYAIGIECDAPRHPILKTARAREVWRRSVLRLAVPHVHRVSSYAWMHARDQEHARLRAAILNAMSPPAGRRAG